MKTWNMETNIQAVTRIVSPGKGLAQGYEEETCCTKALISSGVGKFSENRQMLPSLFVIEESAVLRVC